MKSLLKSLAVLLIICFSSIKSDSNTTNYSVNTFKIHSFVDNNSSFPHINVGSINENDLLPVLALQSNFMNLKIHSYLVSPKSFVSDNNSTFNLSYLQEEKAKAKQISFEVRSKTLYSLLYIRLLHLYGNDYYGGKPTKTLLPQTISSDKFISIVKKRVFEKVFDSTHLKCSYYAIFYLSKSADGNFLYKYHYSIGNGGGRTPPGQVCLDNQFVIVNQGIFVDPSSTCSIKMNIDPKQIKKISDGVYSIPISTADGYKGTATVAMLDSKDDPKICFSKTKKSIMA